MLQIPRLLATLKLEELPQWEPGLLPSAVFVTSRVAFLRSYRARPVPVYKTFPDGYHENF